MGYSEIECTLCGVSFNLSRIRTLDEPREYAWSHYSSGKPGTAFVSVNEDANSGDERFVADCDCSDQGCMVAFREDQAVRSRAMRRRRGHGTWDELVLEGLEGQRVDLGEDKADRDWVPGDESGHASTQEDAEEMDYDLERVSGSHNENTEVEDKDNSGTEFCEDHVTAENPKDNSSSDDESEYLTWCEKVAASTHLYVYGYPSDSRDLERIRQFEALRCLADEFRHKVPKELRLPLYVSLESLEEPLRSKIQQGEYKEYTATRDGRLVISPILGHPLSALGLDSECWEHLAGSDCRSSRAYHGSRIAIEEMMNCNVAQGILSKDPWTACDIDPIHEDTSTIWEPELSDEDWEGRGRAGWYLTGLVDDVDAREDGCSVAFPYRHSDVTPNGFTMDSTQFEYADSPMCAMAFHPTCLEVFKRASLKRHGRFDVNALGNWWLSVAEFDYMRDLPRAEDVKRGNGERWNHEVGSEYLAANPCFVPSLKKILNLSQRAETENTKACTSVSLLSALPMEIQQSIMSYLNLVDIASLDVACPELCTQEVIQKCLLNEMPHLWELWCSMPYSKWTGTTAAKIKAGSEAFYEQQAEIAGVLEILKEEGFHKARAQCKQYWDDNREERMKESRTALQEKSAGFVDIQKLDLARLVLRLTKAQNDGDLKGLKNRKRIWTDCNVILDRIQELQEEGKIPPSS